MLNCSPFILAIAWQKTIVDSSFFDDAGFFIYIFGKFAVAFRSRPNRGVNYVKIWL